MSVKLLWFVSSQSDLGFLHSSHDGNRSLASSKFISPYTNLLFQHRADKDKNQKWNPHFCSLRTHLRYPCMGNSGSEFVWRRKTDELVDGPNAPYRTPTALDRWEARLEDLFRGCLFDMLDAALADAIDKFPVDIHPFKDMIEGMMMDLRKSRYENFNKLYLYWYYVAGTIGLMSIPVMGITPESFATKESVYNAALALGIANQLTSILGDVGEDAQRGRIYLPQDELAQARISDEDIFGGKLTDKWRNFMKKLIKRARMLFDEAEEGLKELNASSRWPVWASLLLHRQIRDEIEANDYNNFTKRAHVSKA